MKKATDKTVKSEMRPEYDFSSGVRGKYALRLRGILKRKPGEKPLGKAMAEHKRKEMKLEEAKYAHRARSK
jgi:hypothetical protein